MATDNYKKTTPRLVKLGLIGGTGSGTLKMYYYFRSKVKKEDVADLGQIHLTSSSTLPTDAPVVIATTEPRPYELTHKDGAPTSFASFDAVKVAKQKGWKVKAQASFAGSPGNPASPSFDTATKGLMVFVPVPSGEDDASPKIKFAWRMPAWQAKKITEAVRTLLGIEFPTATDFADLVIGGGGGPGANKRGPTPPRASVTLSDATGTSTTTTFYDPTKTLPANWRQISTRIPANVALE